MVEIEERHWWYRERRALLARELRRIRKVGTALDIGAGGGGNTRVLLAHGWHAMAADYSETAVELARERGLEAIHADAQDLPLPPMALDLVLAFDVLEHIERDDLAVREMVRVLRPGGTALITVPCDMALWSAHDVACQHQRRYSREGLVSLLTGEGLVLDRVRSWNVLLRPVASWRRRRCTGFDLEETPRLVDALLTAVVRTERFLPVGSLPGVSLIVRAHRPR
ncbi:methyltransferase [Planotetraspora silvatica]|uniref:Methyltransferase n=2 Tax=Planotetraspora silvatica TaxID=234614 RepID=A0A8J3UI27_9ACTN|nr:methyltransferase [Planotetraspora silvatica]